MEQRVTVRGIIIKDDLLFAQKLKKEERVVDYWCTPGGGLDAGESLHDGLRREMIEETGVEPVIGRLLYIQQYNDGNRDFLEFFYHITNPNAYETVDLASTTHGQIEVAECGFIDPKTTHILPAFLQETDIIADIESGEAIKEFNYL